MRWSLYELCFLILFLVLVGIIGKKTIPSNITRQTPHGPVISKCKLYGGRFYGFGGGCDESLSWPDIVILGCIGGFLYYILFR